MKIVIGTFAKRPIGHRATMTDQHGNLVCQPYVILREASIEEWIEALTLAGGAPTPEDIRAARGANFYEVSTD